MTAPAPIAFGRGPAPCGHTGTVVVGTFVRCPRCVDDSKPVAMCPECGDTNIEPFKVLADYYSGKYLDKWHCISKGHVFDLEVP
jgi:hypothetical protein